MSSQVHAYVRLPNVASRRHVILPADALVSDLSAAMGLSSGRICTDAGKYLAPTCQVASVAGHGHGPSVFLSVMGGLCGGKGGFGSMLRAQGGRMSSKKPTNTDMCRDLSGRRLKTIKEAKKITDALEKVAEVEAKREAKVSKKIEQGLKALDTANSKKRRFDDETYEKEHHELMESVRETTKLALKTSSAGSSNAGGPLKKVKLSSGSTPARARATSKAKGGALSYWDAPDSDSDSDASSDEPDHCASVATASSSSSSAKLVTA